MSEYEQAVPEDVRKQRQLDHKKKKAGKPLKDPNAPKKPLSAFMIFSNSIREKIRTDNPGASLCTCCTRRNRQRSAVERHGRGVGLRASASGVRVPPWLQHPLLCVLALARAAQSRSLAGRRFLWQHECKAACMSNGVHLPNVLRTMLCPACARPRGGTAPQSLAHADTAASHLH